MQKKVTQYCSVHAELPNNRYWALVGKKYIEEDTKREIFMVLYFYYLIIHISKFVTSIIKIQNDKLGNDWSNDSS